MESLGYEEGDENLDRLFDDDVWRRESHWRMSTLGSETDDELRNWVKSSSSSRER